MNQSRARWLKRLLSALALFAMLLGAAPIDARVHTGARTVEWMLGGGIVLSLEQVPFIRTRHQVTRKGSVVVRIDGREYWGTDGDLPRCELKSARARIGEGSFELPVEGLFEPLLSSPDSGRAQCRTRTGRAGTRIQCDFSDGAGAYRVIWRITPDRKVHRDVEETA